MNQLKHFFRSNALFSLLTNTKIKPFFILLGAYVCRKAFWKIVNKIRNYPNGPMGLPFFGCIFPFAITPRAFLFNVANKYGPLAYVPLVMTNNIIISDPKICKLLYKDKKAYNRPEGGAARPDPTIFTDLNGKNWHRRRKFCSSTVMLLTNLPFVLSQAKCCIDNYIVSIMDEKYINNNKLWYPAKYFDYIVFNTLWAAVFDATLPFNDPFISSYCQMSQKFFNTLAIGRFFDLLTNYNTPNFIKRIFVWKYTKDMDKLLLDWMNNNGFIIDINKETFKRINSKCINEKVYVDFLIKKLENKEITIKEIVTDIQFALLASIDATSKALEFGFLLLAKYPKIQEMVYNEIVSVMKTHNLKEFNLTILNELHIFRAFIYEALRISCIAPITTPHMLSSEDCKININGRMIHISKNCLLQSNFYYMHKYLDWGNNNKPLKEENNDIHLEYWLNPMDKTFKRNENFLLFGVGKRDCVGQSLAMRALYAIYGIFMTKYKFIAPKNDPKTINIKQSFGMVMTVDPPIGIQLEKR